MVLVGLALIVFGGDSGSGAGVITIGSAALVALAGALARFSSGEMADRDREQAARDFYAEHGRWPDDPEPAVLADPPATPEPAADPHVHPGVRDAGRLSDRAGGRRRRPPPRRPRRPRPGP